MKNILLKITELFSVLILLFLAYSTFFVPQANAQAAFSAKINFQPAGAPIPTGYSADTGSVFGNRGNGYSYGWDIDNSAQTRDRNAPNSPDQRYDTLTHIQLYGTYVWEISVPNGTYSVHLVSGDPSSYDSIHKVNVEGVLTVDGTPLSTTPWIEGTKAVSVTDGRLTITNAEGSSNNKLNFIEINSASGNFSPNTPTVTEPAIDGQVVHPADVHMETTAFSDPNPGDTHVCTDWEIRIASTNELVWSAPCHSLFVHIHLGDGTFVNSYSGRTELFYDTNYILRVRHKDSSGDSSTQWSQWVQRQFKTSTQPAPGTTVAWTLRQNGYQIEAVAGGFQLPVNIAFIPNAGTLPTSPYYYVTELYGNIKVVTQDGTVSDYIRGVLNYRPSGIFPGSGEQGLTGIAVDPLTGDVFAGMLYLDANGSTYPKIMRFRSSHGGSVAGSYSTILDMAGESQGASHQISNISIGPDNKLYVHMGDGFDTSTAQNLNSFRGKILRMNFDGSPLIDNPFYDAADGINSKDYVFAYGFRNPFGGAWRASDGVHYEVENGPSVDRLAKIVRGRNYLWDGTDNSMGNYAIYNWSPSTAPVNIAFIQSQTFGGSGFPTGKLDHAFVTESGPTYATGPQNGKRISEFTLDTNGNLVSGPIPLLEYTGTGKATAVGLAAGPDGLYFTDLYKDNSTNPTDPGANVYRIRYIGNGSAPTVNITYPNPGTTFNAPANITINANASDTDGNIAKVEFFQGATKLGEDTTFPYSFSWNNVGAGNYSLSAKATDNSGLTTISSSVNITVNSVGDFTISASPSVRNVKRGGSITYNVTITPLNGFSGGVNLSVSGLPSGATVSFSPNPGISTSTMTVSTSSSTPLGSFDLNVKGTSNNLVHSDSVTLSIKK